jgi:hypothetical protein
MAIRAFPQVGRRIAARPRRRVAEGHATLLPRALLVLTDLEIARRPTMWLRWKS